MSQSKPQIPQLTGSELSWGARYLLFQLVFLPGMLGALLRGIWSGFPALGINLIFYVINFVAIVFILRAYLEKDIAVALENAGRLILAAIAGLALYWVSNLALASAIQRLWPDFFNVNDATISAISKDNLLLLGLGTVVFVPVAEELLYRGLLFGAIRRRSRVLAYLISVAVFCAIHVSGYWGQYEPLHLALCFVQYIPAGLILAGAYDFSGSIFAPILIHTSINLIGILSMR